MVTINEIKAREGFKSNKDKEKYIESRAHTMVARKKSVSRLSVHSLGRTGSLMSRRASMIKTEYKSLNSKSRSKSSNGSKESDIIDDKDLEEVSETESSKAESPAVVDPVELSVMEQQEGYFEAKSKNRDKDDKRIDLNRQLIKLRLKKESIMDHKKEVKSLLESMVASPTVNNI